MDAIDRQHSITAAAKSAKMSYRRAWSLIQEINAAAGETLVEAAVGGPQGGGARLTARGRFALDVYERLQTALCEDAVDVLRRSISPADKALPCVHLAAAISLQEVVSQLLAEYALRRPAVLVRAVYGASNELVDLLLSGAPGDVFLSADATEMDRLDGAKKLTPRSRSTIAFNGLAAIGLPGSKTKSLTDLVSKKTRNVVLADPACPLGRYSKTYLESAGVYEKLLPKVIHVDNSRAVLSAVVSGTAEAGLAFTSDAERAEQLQTLFRVPHAKAAAEYLAGVVRGGKQPAEARSLLEFIASPAAAKYFRRCGLRPA
jgi:molybdate transport system substrate-binding protein